MHFGHNVQQDLATSHQVFDLILRDNSYVAIQYRNEEMIAVFSNDKRMKIYKTICGVFKVKQVAKQVFLSRFTMDTVVFIHEHYRDMLANCLGVFYIKKVPLQSTGNTIIDFKESLLIKQTNQPSNTIH